MKRILIREAHLYEFDDIRRFYECYPDDHVMLRAPDVVNAAISGGGFFLAIDTSLSEEDRIIGASAGYSISAQLEHGGSVTLKEAGGSLVIEPYRGFGIHKVFHYCRSLHHFILDRYGFKEYFGAIVCPNDQSVSNIKKMGFDEWDTPPQSLVDARLPYAKEDGQEIKYFKFPMESLKNHAENIIQLHRRGLLENMRTSEQAEMIISVETIKRYNKVLQDIIAIGPFEALEWSDD